MLRDLMRRKEIIERSRVIAEDIMRRYPPDADTVTHAANKVELRKKHRKLVKALQSGRAEVNMVIRDMALGVYGKAKVYKTIQDAMLEKGYAESSARIIIEEMVGTI